MYSFLVCVHFITSLYSIHCFWLPPQTERVKNLLQYGRVGLSDPFLALQRDSIGGSVVRGGGVNEAELRALEETQLAQLEHLIAQQRKAHQRMRHVLREAEKVRETVRA